MFEKGWFVPVKRDGSIYYVKAEEGAENAVEGEFVIAAVEMPLLRNPKKLTEEERREQEEEIERRKVNYYIPATDDVKESVKQKCMELGAALARHDIQQEREYAKRGLNYWEERRKQLEMTPEDRRIAAEQKEQEQKAAAKKAREDKKRIEKAIAESGKSVEEIIELLKK